MTRAETRRFRPLVTGATVALAAGVMLVGCGSSSPSSSSTTAIPAAQASLPADTVKSVTPPSPAAVLQRTRSGKQSGKGSVLVRRPDVVQTGRVVQSGAETPASSGDDTSPPRQHTGQSPCALVSTATAQSLVRSRIVSRSEAPLGPTCIYKLAHGKQITIAVEAISFSAVARELGRHARVKVAGRPAFCGTRGTQALFVALHSGQVLNVTAPCGVAQRLAAQALTQLHD